MRPRHRAWMRLDGFGIDQLVGDLDDEAAPVRHRVPGVDGEVHEELLDLARIGHDGPQVTSQRSLDLDVVAEQALKHVDQIRDQRADVQSFGRDDLTAGESQQLPGETRRPFPGRGHFLQIDSGRVVRRQFRRQVGAAHFDVAQNRREEVVEIVSHATGEAADPLHLLCLEQLILEGLRFGDVLDQPVVGSRRAIHVET